MRGGIRVNMKPHSEHIYFCNLRHIRVKENIEGDMQYRTVFYPSGTDWIMKSRPSILIKLKFTIKNISIPMITNVVIFITTTKSLHYPIRFSETYMSHYRSLKQCLKSY